jgi:hypothetical protein
VADDQESWQLTHAEYDETVLGFRMIRIVDEPGILVVEDCFRLVERDAVFA